MSAGNATYDVLWGVPDGEGLACAPNASDDTSDPALPICVNTSSHFYDGNWTMANVATWGLGGGGLTAATSYGPQDFNTFVSPYAVWTAEIAFPFRSNGGTRQREWHGGLLDAGPPYANHAFENADPTTNTQTYWHIDLSRAEHPRRYTSTNPTPVVEFCPLGCSSNLSGTVPDMNPPTSAECAAVKAEWPTLLGTDPWSCYWEWAIADVGPNAYMHRPLYWATLQFAEPDQSGASDLTCGQMEWPSRYISRLILLAERAHKAQTGAYTASFPRLLDTCAKTDGCDADDLTYALDTKDRFTTLALDLPQKGSCGLTGCFRATVAMTIDGFDFVTTVDSNSKVETTYGESSTVQRPCLFTTQQNSLTPGTDLKE